jgi:hypothetical protein
MFADEIYRLQFTLVDAFGKKVIANTHRNSDLFWCLRGGGGGTFGVLTEVVYKTRQYNSRVLFVSHNLRKIPDIITSWQQLSLSLLQIQQWGWAPGFPKACYVHLFVLKSHQTSAVFLSSLILLAHRWLSYNSEVFETKYICPTTIFSSLIVFEARPMVLRATVASGFYVQFNPLAKHQNSREHTWIFVVAILTGKEQHHKISEPCVLSWLSNVPMKTGTLIAFLL